MGRVPLGLSGRLGEVEGRELWFGREAKAREEGAWGSTEVPFEITGEITGLSIAQLRGDGLDRLSSAEELGRVRHPLGLEEGTGTTAEVALTTALELSDGEMQLRGGGGDVIAGTVGEVRPVGLSRAGDGRFRLSSHSKWRLRSGRL